MLDGASHVSFLSGSTMMLPFPDAMQEFKVESSGTGAQRGIDGRLVGARVPRAGEAIGDVTVAVGALGVAVGR